MNYEVSRLRRADRIVGGGAIALFIFVFFFKWYGLSSNVGSISGINLNASYSGWHTFTNSRWIWLLTIVAALVSLAMIAGARRLDGPLQASILVTGLGALSTLLIVYRIIRHPTLNEHAGSFHASAGIKIGIWLGLIAAAAITYGGYLQMRAEGASLRDVRDQASDAFSGMTVPAERARPSAPGGAGAPSAPPGEEPPAPLAPPSALPTAPAARSADEQQPPTPPADA